MGRKKRRNRPAHRAGPAHSAVSPTDEASPRSFDDLMGPLVIGAVPSGFVVAAGLFIGMPADSVEAGIRFGTHAGILIPLAIAALLMRCPRRWPAGHRFGAGLMLGLDLTLVTFGLSLLANRWLDMAPPQTATVEVMSARRTSGTKGGEGQCVLRVSPWREGDGVREVSSDLALCKALDIGLRYRGDTDRSAPRFVQVVAHPGALGLEYISATTPAPPPPSP